MHIKTLKLIATSGFLTALECTKFVFGRAPDPAGGYPSPFPTPSTPLASRSRRLRRSLSLNSPPCLGVWIKHCADDTQIYTASVVQQQPHSSSSKCLCVLQLRRSFVDAVKPAPAKYRQDRGPLVCVELTAISTTTGRIESWH